VKTNVSVSSWYTFFLKTQVKHTSWTLLIVSTKNERDPPLFTGKLLIKFQNILRNTTQVIIRHRVKILFSVISSPITLERQKWKSSKMKEILFCMSYDNLSSVSQNVLKFYQQLIGEERRVPFIFGRNNQ
jgi:two-component sensor histidine kinase